MSKANSKGRKRANLKQKAVNKKPIEKPKTVEEKKSDRANATPLMVQEPIYFNELVDLSNQFAKLKQQHDQYDFIRVNLIARRNKIAKGDIALPISIQLTQDMYYNESDKKKILKLFDEQIKTITNSVTAVKQQVQVRRDMYVESGLRLLTFAENRFGKYKMKEFEPRSPSLSKKEKALAEKEYDELFRATTKEMQQPGVKKAFDEAMKIAKQKNAAVKLAPKKQTKKEKEPDANTMQSL